MDEFNELFIEDKPVVVFFTASWAEPCQVIEPQFEQLSTEVTDIVFASVDVDKAGEVAQHYHVQEPPTFLLIKGGNVVYEICDANFDDLKAKINEEKLLIESSKLSGYAYLIAKQIELQNQKEEHFFSDAYKKFFLDELGGLMSICQEQPMNES